MATGEESEVTCVSVWGLWRRVQDLGCGVSGLGSLVEGLGFRVQGLRFRV